MTVALAAGAIGLGCLVIGATWPWLTSTGPSGLLGDLPAPWLLWLPVLAAVVGLALGFLGARLRWLLLPAVVALAATVVASVTADPGWLCVDGFDDEGNMVGGCHGDEWTLSPVVFAVGLLLSGIGAVLASLARRPLSAPATP